MQCRCSGRPCPHGGGGAGRGGIRGRCHQPGSLGARGGHDDGIEVHAIHAPGLPLAVVGDLDGRDAPAGMYGMPVVPQPCSRGLGPQRAQVPARQQQVGATASTEQAVAQHTQEHGAAGSADRRVERGNAQGIDEFAQEPLGKSLAELFYGGAGRAAKAGKPPAHRTAQQGHAVSQGPAAGACDAADRIPGRRRVGKAQSVAIREHEGERGAQQRGFRIDAHQPHQTQAFGVGADQDVLAVVQAARGRGVRAFRRRQGACPASQHAGRLEDGDGVACLRGSDGRSQAGPARTDDGHLHAVSRQCEWRGPGVDMAGRSGASPSHPAQRLHLPRQPQLAQGRERDSLVQHLELVPLDFPQQGPVDAGHHQAGFLCPPLFVREQGQGLVIEAMGAFGLEAHQRRETVGILPLQDFVGLDVELLQLRHGKVDAAHHRVFPDVPDDVRQLESEAQRMGVFHGAFVGRAEDARRHLADDAGHQVAIPREALEVQVTGLLEIHLASLDHGLQVALLDTVGAGVGHQGLHHGMRRGLACERPGDLRLPPGQLGPGDAGVRHLVHHVVHLTAERIEGGDGGPPGGREEQECVIEAAAGRRGFLLDVLFRCHEGRLSHAETAFRARPCAERGVDRGCRKRGHTDQVKNKKGPEGPFVLNTRIAHVPCMEREKSLELSTSTLARLRSTN